MTAAAFCPAASVGSRWRKGDNPPELPGEPNDKIQHILAFATLGFLAGWAYARTSSWRLFAGLSLYGALIEAVQAIPPLNRDSDIKDWIADTVACGLVLLMVAWFRSRQSRETGGSELYVRP